MNAKLLMHKFYAICFETGLCPTDWNKSDIKPIPKKDKDNKSRELEKQPSRSSKNGGTSMLHKVFFQAYPATLSGKSKNVNM